MTAKECFAIFLVLILRVVRARELAQPRCLAYVEVSNALELWFVLASPELLPALLRSIAAQELPAVWARFCAVAFATAREMQLAALRFPAVRAGLCAIMFRLALSVLIRPKVVKEYL